LFSGGETRKDAGPRSEAQSYWAIAESKGWFGESQLTSTFLVLYFTEIINWHNVPFRTFFGIMGFEHVLLISLLKAVNHMHPELHTARPRCSITFDN
jgi:hypothetical protein